VLRLKKLPFRPKTRQKASDPATWKPVRDRITTPTGGVALAENSLFRRTMEVNEAYLLDSFSVDHMLYPFRRRAGQADAPGGDKQIRFWDTLLRGSNAGRFLMGAANSLRWIPNPELKARVDAVVDGIAACAREDGYMYAFPPEEMLHGAPGTNWSSAQESNYARAWITHGLIDAAESGNPKALALIRAGHDWFNTCDDLAELNTVCVWPQGHIASTRMYLSPLGKPEDLQVAEAWYVVDEWMDQLIARDPEALWKTGLAWPHCYNLTACEAYLDHYRATGDARFLDAMLGAWEMIQKYWVHLGGSIALCESCDYPPSSYFIDPKKNTGEFCGSVFWARFSQRLHNLFPDEEKYAAEIEHSIYNVALANIVPREGIRYHARLESVKDEAGIYNTCCEGQGTRMLGSLPEYIYSLAPDGVYVNLYEPSKLGCTLQGHGFQLDLETGFPYQNRVTIRVATFGENRMGLRLRVPGWMKQPMPVFVNGREFVTGEPGSYVLVDRNWKDGDVVTFDLAPELTLTRYRGADNFEWEYRYGLEYGPILMAFVGPLGLAELIRAGQIPAKTPDGIFTIDPEIPVLVPQNPVEPATWLHPIPEKPLHFSIDGCPLHTVMPYWQVPDGQTFTCFPVLSGRD
jgi:DUF1680 family protein